MDKVKIYHRLDLLLYLTNTITGSSITGKTFLFSGNGKIMDFIEKEAGVFAFINLNRARELEVTIQSAEYEEQSLVISFPEETGKTVIRTVGLIPRFGEFRSISGKIKGLVSLECMNTDSNCHRVKEVQDKKIVLYQPEKIPLLEDRLGFYIRDANHYQPFFIKKFMPDGSLEADRQLSFDKSMSACLGRIIRGMVKPNGNYVLRTPEKQKVYLVRYVMDGTEKFKVLDFSKQDHINI